MSKDVVYLRSNGPEEIIPEPCFASFLESANGDIGDVCIRCPECGYDYSHVRSVHTDEGYDPHEGAGAYTGTVSGAEKTPYRRAALVITFEGECDHDWQMRIQQHKGQNFVSAVVVPKVNESPS